jgi:hypothetical protein
MAMEHFKGCCHPIKKILWKHYVSCIIYISFWYGRKSFSVSTLMLNHSWSDEEFVNLIRKLTNKLFQ